MNTSKRNLIKNIFLSLVAAPLLVKELCKPADLVFDGQSHEINPEYVNAEYEVHFWCDENAFKELVIGPPPVSNIDLKQFWNGETSL